MERRRSLRIVVTPQLGVNVFAPTRTSRKRLDEAIQRRAQWIVDTLARVATCQLVSLPNRLVTGEKVTYLGRDYRLAVVQDISKSADLVLDTLVIAVPDPQDERLVARWIDRWYRERGSEVFSKYIRTCVRVASAYGVTEPTFTIRSMRARWGSCSSTGRVTLNLKLLLVPETCIEYVVMHELCHMVHHNHSKRYYALLTKCMPDWKERKRILDGYRIE